MRWARQMSTALVVFSAILFVDARRLDWLAGWACLRMDVLTQVYRPIPGPL